MEPLIIFRTIEAFNLEGTIVNLINVNNFLIFFSTARAERVEDKGDVWNRSWVRKLDHFRDTMAATAPVLKREDDQGEDEKKMPSKSSSYPRQKNREEYEMVVVNHKKGSSVKEQEDEEKELPPVKKKDISNKTFSQSKGCSGFRDILFSVTKVMFLVSFIVAFVVHSIAIWNTPEPEEGVRLKKKCVFLYLF